MWLFLVLPHLPVDVSLCAAAEELELFVSEARVFTGFRSEIADDKYFRPRRIFIRRGARFVAKVQTFFGSLADESRCFLVLFPSSNDAS